MNSHELARQLLEGPDGPLVVQAGHALGAGDLADTLIDLSPNLDSEICLEVGNQKIIDTWAV